MNAMLRGIFLFLLNGGDDSGAPHMTIVVKRNSFRCDRECNVCPATSSSTCCASENLIHEVMDVN